MPPLILNNNIISIIVNYFILIIVILFEECDVVVLCFQSVTFSRLESALRIDWSSPNCQQKLKRTPSTFFIMQGIVLTITKGIYYNTHKLSPARLVISKQLVMEDVTFLTQLFVVFISTTCCSTEICFSLELLHFWTPAVSFLLVSLFISCSIEFY